MDTTTAQSRAPIAEVHGAQMPDVCPCCGGDGFLYFTEDDGERTWQSGGRCHECRGTGEIFAPQKP